MTDALRASIVAATTAVYRFQSDSNEINASSLDTHLEVTFYIVKISLS